MSSLAAARADGYYHPPDFDPRKHGNVKDFNMGRKRKIQRSKTPSTRTVVFEMPFDVFCVEGACGRRIAKGSRFNAHKLATGKYLSTPIFTFSFTHVCGADLAVRTDPQHRTFAIVQGLKRAAGPPPLGEPNNVEDQEERMMRALRAANPLAALEHERDQQKVLRREAQRERELFQLATKRIQDPITVSQQMRARNRASRRQAHALERQAAARGLHVALLPVSDADHAASDAIVFGKKRKRRKTRDEGIFARSTRYTKKTVRLPFRPST